MTAASMMYLHPAEMQLSWSMRVNANNLGTCAYPQLATTIFCTAAHLKVSALIIEEAEKAFRQGRALMLFGLSPAPSIRLKPRRRWTRPAGYAYCGQLTSLYCSMPTRWRVAGTTSSSPANETATYLGDLVPRRSSGQSSPAAGKAIMPQACALKQRQLVA